MSTVQVFMDEIIGKLCYLLVYFVGNVFSCASAGLSKVAWLRVKIAAYLIGIGQLLCLAFLYGWRFLNKIYLDWPLTLATQPSTSKLSDNPASGLLVLLIIVFEHSFPLVIQLLARNWRKLIIPVVAFRCVECLVHTPEFDFVLQRGLL